MTIDKKLLIFAVVVLGVGIAFWWRQTRTAHAQTESNVRPWRPQRLNLEDKAKQAEKNDLESVRALVDEVFSQPHASRRLPPFIEDPLKERLVRAELNYRSGRGRPVKESDIVQLANSFADKFALPAFAKTSEHQVRELRFLSMLYTPAFMGKGLTKDEDGRTPMQIGDSINSTMSPLQAVHLTMFLFQAKLMNPDDQLAPDDWEADQYQKGLAQWKRAQLAKSLDSEGKPRPAESKFLSGEDAGIGDLKHFGELEKLLEKATAAMSPKELLDLGHSVLNTLGIERGDNQ